MISGHRIVPKTTAAAKPCKGAKSKSYFRMKARNPRTERCWRWSEKREGSKEDKAGLR